jgi:hypothetical protein
VLLELLSFFLHGGYIFGILGKAAILLTHSKLVGGNFFDLVRHQN